jgi:hypothetical protein
VIRDVTFEEEIDFQRSRESQMEIDSEKNEETVSSPPLEVQRETVIDPVDPIDIPRDIEVGHKRHAWAQQTLQEAEGHATPCGTF